MLTIYYSPDSKEISGWKGRLENMVVSYQLVEQKELAEPFLLDGREHVTGTASIDNYLCKLDEFVKGWYEDRCDKHDFSPVNP